jgi:hypothetical protein
MPLGVKYLPLHDVRTSVSRLDETQSHPGAVYYTRVLYWFSFLVCLYIREDLPYHRAKTLRRGMGLVIQHDLLASYRIVSYRLAWIRCTPIEKGLVF